jgi:hypothetical protein
MSKVQGNGTVEKLWLLQTPPGTSDFEAPRDEGAEEQPHAGALSATWDAW